MVDYLIVGAGFTGCVLAERIASQLGKTVMIVEKRNHIGGNAYDYYNEAHVLVHKYGPHIFHTNAKRVWEYLTRFTDWNFYFHRVLASLDGMLIPVPFNLNSLHSVFPKNYAERLEQQLIANFGYGAKIPILKLRETSDEELKFLAEFIYEKIFLGYTAKQWARSPEELDASVTARIPVFISRDDRYFQDAYQGIPSLGYTSMFQRLTEHPNIFVLLNADYRHVAEAIPFKRLIYTGPIDEYFGYIHGALPYRSLRFDMTTCESSQLEQPVAQVNYPNEYDFTRITEFRHLTMQRSDRTTLAVEYPQPYIIGQNEPYYPIPQEENNELFKKYRKEADALRSVTFAGRLADYRYYNMDQVVARAITVFEQTIAAH